MLDTSPPPPLSSFEDWTRAFNSKELSLNHIKVLILMLGILIIGSSKLLVQHLNSQNCSSKEGGRLLKYEAALSNSFPPQEKDPPFIESAMYVYLHTYVYTNYITCIRYIYIQYTYRFTYLKHTFLDPEACLQLPRQVSNGCLHLAALQRSVPGDDLSLGRSR